MGKQMKDGINQAVERTLWYVFLETTPMNLVRPKVYGPEILGRRQKLPDSRVQISRLITNSTQSGKGCSLNVYIWVPQGSIINLIKEKIKNTKYHIVSEKNWYIPVRNH